MRIWIIISVLLLASVFSQSQPAVKTIVPEKHIIAGQPFRIQYVVFNADDKQLFMAPYFRDFEVITGPEVYSGVQQVNGKNISIKNYIYTLVTGYSGIYSIPGCIVKTGNTEKRSRNITITVAEKPVLTPDAVNDFSAYILMPAEDPYRKIRENLFVELSVDKRSCYVGEPVVATFKLYSRLQSKSDIVKNPGFYGFSVYDMINLENKVKETERINGKYFDVHTIRKVQLYPLQPGLFIIDAMEIENKTEFSRSLVNKKTEQQISEGILSTKEETITSPGTEIFESTLKTEPIKINVKPAPLKNKPANYNGATGDFIIAASVEKNELAKNEEGFLVITIRGRGNFTQIAAPVINWPPESEGFEPAVTDLFDKSMSPLSGSKVFRYPFISAKPGTRVIPGIEFSFFSTDSNRYSTVFTENLSVHINNNEFKKRPPAIADDSGNKITIEEANKRVSRIAFILVAVLVTVALSYWIFRGVKKKPGDTETAPVVALPGIDEILKPAGEQLQNSSRHFYSAIQQSIWNYLSLHYHLSGTDMNKTALAEKLRRANHDELIIAQLTELLQHCETEMFANIISEENKEELLDKTKKILAQLKS